MSGEQYQDHRRDNGGRWGNHGQDYQGGEGYDVNHVRMSGTVERFETVATSTGTPMIRFGLRCAKEWAQVVAFNDLAASVKLQRGDRVEVTGRIKSTHWMDREGNAKNGWQIVAKAIIPERPADRQGQRPAYRPERGGVFGLAKGRHQGGHDLDGRQQRLPGAGSTWSKERPGVMVYQGGPF